MNKIIVTICLACAIVSGGFLIYTTPTLLDLYESVDEYDKSAQTFLSICVEMITEFDEFPPECEQEIMDIIDMCNEHSGMKVCSHPLIDM